MSDADAVDLVRASALEGRTGRGVRIAIIDSGVHPNHPHIGGIESSVAFGPDGAAHGDAVDRVGHGTAVAAVIHEKAPEAALLIVKVFDRGLVTTSAALVAAMRWSLDAGVDLINLSLGTTNEDRRDDLLSLAAEATGRGVSIVAAAPTPDRQWLPGALAGVTAVDLDWSRQRDECLVIRQADGQMRIRASGYPRPIPGVSPDQNVKGHSFAVANATGLLALMLRKQP